MFCTWGTAKKYLTTQPLQDKYDNHDNMTVITLRRRTPPSVASFKVEARKASLSSISIPYTRAERAGPLPQRFCFALVASFSGKKIYGSLKHRSITCALL